MSCIKLTTLEFQSFAILHHQGQYTPITEIIVLNPPGNIIIETLPSATAVVLPAAVVFFGLASTSTR